jgi:hypothetical protein
MSSINYEEEDDAVVVDSEEEREGMLSLASLPMQAPSKRKQSVCGSKEIGSHLSRVYDRDRRDDGQHGPSAAGVPV